MKETYSVGDTVKYIHYKYIEHVCECCGQETDSETIEKERESVIEKITMEHFYSFQLMDISEEVETMPDGSRVIKPSFSEIKPLEPEPYYHLANGDKITKNKIISHE